MKQIIALVLLSTWMLLIIIMMGEPQMNDQVNESVGSGPQWIGWTLVAFILFTPFIVIKLMDGKTKQAKHNTYIHGINNYNMSKLTFTDGQTFDLSGPLRLEERYDGWYVLGNNRMIPVSSQDAGRKLIDDELAKVYNIIDIMNKLNN